MSNIANCGKLTIMQPNIKTSEIPANAKNNPNVWVPNCTKAVLEWALDFSGKSVEELESQGMNVSAWLNYTENPTNEDLDKFAKTTYVGRVWLSLDAPPNKKLGVQDLRQWNGKFQTTPKGNVLDLLQECTMLKCWYIGHCEENDLGTVGPVRKYNIKQNPAEVAKDIVDQFAFPAYATDMNRYVELIEEQGILVMRSGVTQSNPNRPIYIEDLRGFALVDEYAPVIFVNTRDTANARKLALMHELAHILIGCPAVSNVSVSDKIDNKVESWCNKFATEALLPEDKFREVYEAGGNNRQKPFANLDALSKKFGVCPLLIMRRIYDLGYYKNGSCQFWQDFYSKHKEILMVTDNESIGDDSSDYCRLVSSRYSKKLCIALLADALYNMDSCARDAYRLLHIYNTETLKEIAKYLKVTRAS